MDGTSCRFRSVVADSYRSRRLPVIDLYPLLLRRLHSAIVLIRLVYQRCDGERRDTSWAEPSQVCRVTLTLRAVAFCVVPKKTKHNKKTSLSAFHSRSKVAIFFPVCLAFLWTFARCVWTNSSCVCKNVFQYTAGVDVSCMGSLLGLSHAGRMLSFPRFFSTFLFLPPEGLKKVRNPDRMYRSAVCYAGHGPPKSISDDTETNSKSQLLILATRWPIYYSFIDSFIYLLISSDPPRHALPPNHPAPTPPSNTQHLLRLFCWLKCLLYGITLSIAEVLSLTKSDCFGLRPWDQDLSIPSEKKHTFPAINYSLTLTSALWWLNGDSCQCESAMLAIKKKKKKCNSWKERVWLKKTTSPDRYVGLFIYF